MFACGSVESLFGYSTPSLEVMVFIFRERRGDVTLGVERSHRENPYSHGRERTRTLVTTTFN